MVRQLQLLGRWDGWSVLMRQRGVSLIELMIGLIIIALLAMVGAPSAANWIRNMRIRTATESIASGLQLARAEALRRNTIMRFQLVSTLGSDCQLSTSGPHWIVSRNTASGECDSEPSDTEGPRIVQTRNGSEGGGGQTLIASDQNSFTFNGLGRMTSTPGSINVTGSDGANGCVASGGTKRCLRIELTPGGGMRMCDPALPEADAQACTS